MGRPSVLFGHEGRAGVPASAEGQPAPMYAGRAPHPLGALPRTPAGKAPAGPTRKRRAGRGVDAMNTSTRGRCLFLRKRRTTRGRCFLRFTQSKTPYIRTATKLDASIWSFIRTKDSPETKQGRGVTRGPAQRCYSLWSSLFPSLYR